MRTIGIAMAIGLATVSSSAFAAETEAAGSSEASVSVSANDADPSEEVNDTEVILTPYLWVAGIKGDIGIPRGDSEAEVDKSFGDLLSDLNFAFMGAVDIRHKRFVALGDLMYLDLTTKTETVDSPVFVEGEVDSSLLVATAAVGYRVVDQGPMFVDLFAGARVVSLDVNIALTGPLQTRERDASPTGVSALLGGRVRVPLGEKWGLLLYGDFGGILGDSDIKWQALGTIQRDLGKHWRMALGYRYMSVDHEGSDLKFDMTLSGPILGVSYKF